MADLLDNPEEESKFNFDPMFKELEKIENEFSPEIDNKSLYELLEEKLNENEYAQILKILEEIVQNDKITEYLGQIEKCLEGKNDIIMKLAEEVIPESLRDEFYEYFLPKIYK